jgi:hypothetical protein
VELLHWDFDEFFDPDCFGLAPPVTPDAGATAGTIYHVAQNFGMQSLATGLWSWLPWIALFTSCQQIVKVPSVEALGTSCASTVASSRRFGYCGVATRPLAVRYIPYAYFAKIRSETSG